MTLVTRLSVEPQGQGGPVVESAEEFLLTLVESGAVGERGASLASGAAGVAIALASVMGEGSSSRHRNAIARAMQLAVVIAKQRGQSYDLWMGGTGIAWALAVLSELGLVKTSDADPAAAADAALLGLPRDLFSALPCDVIGGWSGIGLYALARSRQPAGRELVRLLLEFAEHSALDVKGGICWRGGTPATKDGHPTTVYGVGLAHGVCGPLAFFTGCVALDVEACRARALAMRALGWVEAHPAQGPLLSWPARVSDGKPVPPWVNSWCWGPVGMAIVADGLQRVGIATRDAGRIERWLTGHLGSTAALPAANDLSICHGVSGPPLGGGITGLPSEIRAELQAAHESDMRRLLDAQPKAQWRHAGLLEGAGGCVFAHAAITGAAPHTMYLPFGGTVTGIQT